MPSIGAEIRGKVTRRRSVRFGLVASLLVAAALLLSGCWANVYNFGGGQRSITLTKDISAQIIWNCTAKKGTGAPRAFCALDTVNALCRAFPIKGVSDDDCVLLASYGDWHDMDHAIQEVVGPGADCLIYYENPDPNDNFWGSIRSGIFGCK